MKQKIRFILPMVVVFVMAIVSFSSCEKEEASGGGNVDSLPNVIYAPVKGENLEWSFDAPAPKLSKGYHHDADWWEYGTAYYKDNTSHTFKTLKVYRRNDPDKYFYVMLTNLDIKADKHCWAYNDDERNVAKYGYMYTWMKAEELARKVYMEFYLPAPRTGNLTLSKRFGRLMTFEDLKDILESDVIPEQAKDGNQLREDNGGDMFYDAFVFGPEYAYGDFTNPAQHTLGGNRAPDWYTEKEMARYGGLNLWGNFWLNEKEYNPDYHYFLTVQRGGGKEKFDYSAFVNHMMRDYNGLSVRYVFDPYNK